MNKELDILIIEDLAHDAELIERELKISEVPFRSRRVETRKEFLEALQQRAPDLILSDFTLPEFDAIQALHTLQTLGLAIPFILVTGTRSEEVAVECIREGAEDYILKASLKRLPTSISNALLRKRIEHARQRAETALRRSEEQYRLIANHTQDLICIIDPNALLEYASPSHSNLGYEPERLIGSRLLDIVHDEDHRGLMLAWEEAQRTNQSQTAEIRLRTTSGAWRVFETVGNWIFDDRGAPQSAVVVSRDVTQRKQAEEALRELPRLIREAQESERHRVARELHDSVNQILSAVKFRIQTVEERIEATDEVAWRESLKAKAHLERAMQEVRRISRNLRPSELDDLGLVPAARSLCSDFSERTGIKVDLSFSKIPQHIPAEIELNIYRILQEALGNIEKHAQASRVKLQIGHKHSVLKARIRDDGRGFDPDARNRPKVRGHGMGLVDMRERAMFVGGNCTLRSTPGRGTEIVVEMPLPSVEHSKVKPGEKGQTKED